jgi:hypothetical protein
MRLLAIPLFLTAALGVPPVAAQAPTVLAGEGVVYRLVRGTCESLGACPNGATADNAALALEWEVPGEAVRRELVPGTEDAATENYPSLAIDRASDRVYVVWEAKEVIHSTLRVASYGDGEWHLRLQVAGNPFSFKRNPSLAVTHDEYRRLDDTGTVVDETRLVLHLVWWDLAADGGRPLYVALVLRGGELVDNWNIVELGDLLPAASAETALAPGLFQSPQARTVGNGSRALIAFGDPAGGRIATLEVDVVGGDVVSFADTARAQIIDIARNGGTRQAIADGARAQIIDIARRVLPEQVAAFLSAKFLELVATSDPGDELTVVVDEARAQIIDIARRHREGIQLASAAARAQIIDIARASEIHYGDPGADLATFRVARAAAAPAVPDRAIRILTSDDGVDIALAWDTDSSIRYRQLEAGAWSDPRTLAIGAKMSRDQAYALILQRLQQR